MLLISVVWLHGSLLIDKESLMKKWKNLNLSQKEEEKLQEKTFNTCSTLQTVRQNFRLFKHNSSLGHLTELSLRASLSSQQGFLSILRVSSRSQEPWIQKSLNKMALKALEIFPKRFSFNKNFPNISFFKLILVQNIAFWLKKWILCALFLKKLITLSW